MCKIYTGYHDTSEIEYALCACTADNPLVKARGLSLRISAHACSISHLFLHGKLYLDLISYHKKGDLFRVNGYTLKKSTLPCLSFDSFLVGN